MTRIPTPRRAVPFGTILVLLVVAPAAADSATTERVSVSSTGREVRGTDGTPSISGKGRFVVFESTASKLVRRDTNDALDVFVRDRKADTTTRVSVSSSERQGNGHSHHPVISRDGRFVAFLSDASNLVPGDTNRAQDVFVRDRARGTTARVSISSGGRQANRDTPVSSPPDLSAKGRFVAFYSDASNLVEGDTNGVGDVFLRDRLARTTVRVSVGWKGRQANDESFVPSISANGRFVGFTSDATNLTRKADTNGTADVFLRDRVSKTTVRVSVSWKGSQGNGNSFGARITPNGRFVAFSSHASNLNRGGDTNGVGDVFVRDRSAHTTIRVSVSWKGAEAEGGPGSFGGSISDDGQLIAFRSYARNLNRRGDRTRDEDGYVRDRARRTTKMVSVNARGEQSKAIHILLLGPIISADGRVVAFFSHAPLVRRDRNESGDVFTRGPIR